MPLDPSDGYHWALLGYEMADDGLAWVVWREAIIIQKYMNSIDDFPSNQASRASAPALTGIHQMRLTGRSSGAVV